MYMIEWDLIGLMRDEFESFELDKENDDDSV